MPGPVAAMSPIACRPIGINRKKIKSAELGRKPRTTRRRGFTAFIQPKTVGAEKSDSPIAKLHLKNL
jgi:hypothetical protein